ncbi:MAG TPA: TonB-dependent receptor [Thermoanaerobaculia bacterium]|nr:TonB-dependent receptor [Thermoanaerobaculia bacterium]HUM30248.1 TonB-dependent receptor [Thermoanaerobaculia bacterium]HXK68456.1 TonB-dependent receptor [Thermoanaerobaculia bacterium]
MWKAHLAILFLFSASLVTGSDFGEVITVTATLLPDSDLRSGAATTVLEGEDLHQFEEQTVGDLLGLLPGLTTARSGSPGKVTSLFTRGTESDHTLVMFNGVILNSPYFAGFDWSTLPVEGIDRVEVVRGPFSALYGSDAVGGVVQLFSRPQEGFRARLGLGEKGYQHAGATFGTGSFMVHLSTHGENGMMENDTFDQSQALVQAEGEHWNLLYSFGTQEVGIPYNEGMSSPERRMSTRTHTFALPFHTRLYDSFLLETEFTHQYSNFTFSDPDDPWGYTSSDTTTARTTARALLSSTWKRWTLTGGLETRQEDVSDRTAYGVNLDNERIHNEAALINARMANRMTSLTLGVRADRHSAFGTTVHPRASFSIFTGPHTVQISAGTSFRAPSVGELAFPFSGNNDLKPEKGTTFDAGYIYIRRSDRFEARIFLTDLDNLIDFDYTTYSFQNMGTSRIRGLEFQWNHAWGETATVRTSVTVLDHENTDTGQPLLRRPDLSASLILTVHPTLNLQTLVTGRYVGSRDDIDPLTYAREENGAYTCWDLVLHYDMGTVTPFFRVENLFSANYEDILGYPSPGRRVIFGLSIDGGTFSATKAKPD